MNKKLKLILIIPIIFSFCLVSAENTEKYKTITDQITNNKINKNLNIEDIFYYFASFFLEETPESYEYIWLNFKWVEKWSKLEKSLKVLVYNNKIPNINWNFKWLEKKLVSADLFYKLSSKILNTASPSKIDNKNVEYYDLELVEESYKIIKNKILYEKELEKKLSKDNIFEEVYNIILEEHFDKEKFDRKALIYSAIEWLTKWTWDKHTVYFPPTESKDFLSWLSWDFEWIWTYVEMPEPWIFIIKTPIPWWPADKVWIRWWDQVIEVDWKEITKENSQNEIISWIKWEAWTEVNLTIKRWVENIKFKIKREKVHIKSIETSISWNNFIIKIIWFNQWVTDELREAIEELKWKIWIRKIIFDLRDNWGWYLDEVVEMLSFFIKKWEVVANVKYLEDEWNYISKWLNLINMDNYEIVFLQNSWTASASEIMIWTIKDYYPNVKIVWEKSYWKWSVQTIKEFWDWSSFKYTTAKWFTWKNKKWIDWEWIKPDIEIEFDEEKFKNYKIDNQLEKALNI